MQTTLRNIKVALLAIVLAVVAAAFPMQLASAQISQQSKDAACDAIGGASGADCSRQNAGSSVSGLLATAVEILSWIVGAVAVIMIIIAGIKFATANGDSNSISSARSTVLYALVGLAVAAMAQMLVRFVLEETTAPPQNTRGNLSSQLIDVDTVA